jgi:hypothetical protein
MIYEKNNINYNNEINELLINGKNAINKKDWETASLLFSKAIDYNDKCGDAYYGALMAKYHANSPKNMVDIFLEKYNNPDSIAIEYYRDHIDDIITEYKVPGYLSEDEIKNEYDFCNDTVFYSTVDSIMDMKELAMKEISGEKLWSKAMEYGTDNLQAKINNIIEEIKRILDERIDIAKEQYINNVSEVVRTTGQRVIETDKIIINKYNEAREERLRDYNRAVFLFKCARKKADIDVVIPMFDRMKEFRDSDEYLAKCIKIRNTVWLYYLTHYNGNADYSLQIISIISGISFFLSAIVIFIQILSFLY